MHKTPLPCTLAVMLLAALGTSSVSALPVQEQVTLYGQIDAGVVGNDHRLFFMQYTQKHLDNPNLQLDDPWLDRPEARPGSWSCVDSYAKQIHHDRGYDLGSGVRLPSYWGMRGTEPISDDLAVGFVLENGFYLDTGRMYDPKRIFDRESTLQVLTPYVTFGAGRMSTLMSDSGSFGFFGKLVSPFGLGWLRLNGPRQNMAGNPERRDNAIAFKTEDLNGFKFYGQYVMGNEGRENKSNSDRWYSLGMQYDVNRLTIGALVNMHNRSTKTPFTKDIFPLYAGVLDENNLPNGLTRDYFIRTFWVEYPDKRAWDMNLAFNYAFDKVKLYTAGQLFRNDSDPGRISDNFWSYNPLVMARGEHWGHTGEPGTSAMEPVGSRLMDSISHQYFHGMFTADGWDVNLGADISLGNDNLQLGLGYMWGEINARKPLRRVTEETEDSAVIDGATDWANESETYPYKMTFKMRTITLNAAYIHRLSKRTELYVGASAMDKRYWHDMKFSGRDTFNFLGLWYHTRLKHRQYQAAVGLTHRF